MPHGHVCCCNDAPTYDFECLPQHISVRDFAVCGDEDHVLGVQLAEKISYHSGDILTVNRKYNHGQICLAVRLRQAPVYIHNRYLQFSCKIFGDSVTMAASRKTVYRRHDRPSKKSRMAAHSRVSSSEHPSWRSISYSISSLETPQFRLAREISRELNGIILLLQW